MTTIVEREAFFVQNQMSKGQSQSRCKGPNCVRVNVQTTWESKFKLGQQPRNLSRERFVLNHLRHWMEGCTIFLRLRTWLKKDWHRCQCSDSASIKNSRVNSSWSGNWWACENVAKVPHKSSHISKVHSHPAAVVVSLQQLKLLERTTLLVLEKYGASRKGCLLVLCEMSFGRVNHTFPNLRRKSWTGENAQSGSYWKTWKKLEELFTNSMQGSHLVHICSSTHSINQACAIVIPENCVHYRSVQGYKEKLYSFLGYKNTWLCCCRAAFQVDG